MIKKFLASVFTLSILLANMPASAQELPIPEKKTKVMQSRSFSVSEDEKKEMREKIKKNNPDPSMKNYPGTSDVPSQSTENEGHKETQKTEKSTEDHVWKKYKDLTEGTGEDADEEDAPSENEGDDADNGNDDGGEEEQTAEEQEDRTGIAGILKNYKNKNKAQMQSRSFARPEEIKRVEQEEQAEDPEKIEKMEKILKKGEQRQKKASAPAQEKAKSTRKNSKRSKSVKTFETNE